MSVIDSTSKSLIVYGSFSGNNNHKPYVKCTYKRYTENYSICNFEFGIYVGVATSSNASHNLNTHTYKYGINSTSMNQTRSVTFDIRNKSKGTFVKIFSITNQQLNHNADGTLSIPIRASHTTSTSLGTGTISNSLKLESIPRQSSISSISDIVVVNGVNKLEINLDRKVDDYIHDITITLGSKSAFYQNIETALSVTLDVSWLNQIPTSTEGIANVLVKTKNSTGEQIGVNVSSSFKIQVPNYTPVISSFTVSSYNDNSKIKQWESDCKANIYVKGFTRVNLNATSNSYYGASIEKYEYSYKIGTSSYSIVSQKTAQYLTGIVSYYGTVKYICKVTDSRGKTVTSENSITINDYAKPTILDFRIEREKTKVKVFVSYNTSLIKGGTKTYNSPISSFATLYYKKKNDSSWISLGQLNNNVLTTLTNSFEESISYDFMFSVIDYLNGSATQEYGISTSVVLMDWRVGGNGIAIGKMSEKDEFEIAMPTEFTKTVNINIENTSIVLNESGIKINNKKVLTESDLGNYNKGETDVLNDAIVQTIKELSSDTGWQNITLTSNFKSYNNESTPCYRAVGKTVSIKGIISPTSSSNDLGSQTAVQIGEIPAEYAPTGTTVFSVCHGSSMAVWLFSINNKGKIYAERYAIGNSYTTPANTVWMTFSVTYLI